MAQEAAAPEAPAEGQEPEAPKEGQEPQVKPEGESSTFDQLPAETQQEIKKLRQENAAARKRAQEAETKAQDYEDAQKSELEKAQGKATKAEQAKAEAEAKLLRFEVAAEKNVPTKLVPLLTASSREDLEGQADLILENAQAQGPTPQFDGGARETAEQAKTPEQEHNENVLGLLGLKPN